jgi:hypothetical protein
MKTKRSVRLGLLAGVLACGAVAAMPGCELLVDFDRSKIPVGDASAGDDATGDDATASDGATSEAGQDASPTTGSDAGDAMSTIGDGATGTDADAATPPVDASDASPSAPDAADTGAADTGPADTGVDAPVEAAPPGDDSGADASDGT